MFDLSALPERKVFSFAVFFICFHGDRKEVTEKQMRATFFSKKALLTYRKKSKSCLGTVC